MGYDFARDLRASLPEELALRCHLIYNFRPRVSLTMLPVVQEALRLARAGDYASELELPTGDHLSVRSVVEQLHLEAFLDEVQA